MWEQIWVNMCGVLKGYMNHRLLAWLISSKLIAESPNALMIHLSWCDIYKASDDECRDLLSARKLCPWGKGINNSLHGALTRKLSDLGSIWLLVSKSEMIYHLTN